MTYNCLVQFSSEGAPVYLKIADLGISRIMSPGGTMGFKGSPGFMAPEILKYVGMEAVTEKVYTCIYVTRSTNTGRRRIKPTYMYMYVWD